MKKALILVLCAVMLLSLVACGKGGKNPGGNSTNVNADGTIDTSEHVVITYMTTGNKPTDATYDALAELNKLLNEKCNAELDLHFIEWTDYMTNYNLTLASQDGSVDLVGTATDWLDAWPNAKNGAFLELTEDMLKTYAPKTWASVDPAIWDLCKLDGKIYFFPEDNYAQWTNHGFMYRGDWAKEAGLANGVHSWEDMGTYLKYVKENKPDVVPWDAAGAGTTVADTITTGWIYSHGSELYIEGTGVSLFFGKSKDDPYTVSRVMLEGDTLVNYAKNQKAWADAGYWREDVLNYNGDTRTEMYEGLTGTDQHHTETFYGSVRPEMDKRQPGSEVGFFWFGEETGNLVTLNPTHGAMAVARASKHPERALMVYDLIRNDPECYYLVNYGIEGRTYIVDDQNMLARPDSYVAENDGIGFNWWWGRNDDLMIKDGNRAWAPYEALTAQYDKVATTYPYGKLVIDKDKLSAWLDNLSNVFATYNPALAFGKFDDPEAFVAEYRQKLIDAGYEKALEEVQNQINAAYGK